MCVCGREPTCKFRPTRAEGDATLHTVQEQRRSNTTAFAAATIHFPLKLPQIGLTGLVFSFIPPSLSTLASLPLNVTRRLPKQRNALAVFRRSHHDNSRSRLRRQGGDHLSPLGKEGWTAAYPFGEQSSGLCGELGELSFQVIKNQRFLQDLNKQRAHVTCVATSLLHSTEKISLN